MVSPVFEMVRENLIITMKLRFTLFSLAVVFMSGCFVQALFKEISWEKIGGNYYYRHVQGFEYFWRELWHGNNLLWKYATRMYDPPEGFTDHIFVNEDNMILFTGNVRDFDSQTHTHLLVSKNGKAPCDIYDSVISWGNTRGEINNELQYPVNILGIKRNKNSLIIVILTGYLSEKPDPIIEIPWSVILEFIEKAPKAKFDVNPKESRTTLDEGGRERTATTHERVLSIFSPKPTDPSNRPDSKL